MIRKETKTYLKDLYDSINEMSSAMIKFKVALHDLDKLGHNVDNVEKLLNNEQIEFYKLKTFTNDFIKEKLKIWHKISQKVCYNINVNKKGRDTMSLEEYSNYLIENLGVNEEVVNCITSINGYNEDTLDDILYYYTGYRTLEQYTRYEDLETYREYYGIDEEEYED